MGVAEDGTMKQDTDYYETYKSNITYETDHYVAKLPWKEEFP